MPDWTIEMLAGEDGSHLGGAEERSYKAAYPARVVSEGYLAPPYRALLIIKFLTRVLRGLLRSKSAVQD